MKSDESEIPEKSHEQIVSVFEIGVYRSDLKPANEGKIISDNEPGDQEKAQKTRQKQPGGCEYRCGRRDKQCRRYIRNGYGYAHPPGRMPSRCRKVTAGVWRFILIIQGP